MNGRKMNMLTAVIVGWFAASIPVGLVMGRLLARASRPLDEEAEPSVQQARPALSLHKREASRVVPFPQQAQPVPVRNRD
ncbi:MAG TPA: hypothetical protein PKD09_23025 [Aggregatilinea sp.]|nr:hypothetical protein [Aggregatilinea sp.]